MPSTGCPRACPSVLASSVGLLLDNRLTTAIAPAMTRSPARPPRRRPSRRGWRRASAVALADALRRLFLLTVSTVPRPESHQPPSLTAQRNRTVTSSLLRTIRNKIYSVLGWRPRAQFFAAGGRPR